MKELVERIKNDGRVLGEGVLKVDSFITHQVDPELMEAMGCLLYTSPSPRDGPLSRMPSSA